MQGAAPVLGLKVSTDHARVAPGETRLHAVLEIEAGDAPNEVARPVLVTVLALDVSGSMRGEPLEHVVRSVEKIVGLLGDDDRLGVVAFSTGATEVAPVAALDAAHRRAIRSRVGRLAADDRTNIEAGLRLARSILPPPAEGERHGVVLLSDGEPNVGASTPDELRELARSLRGDVSVSTLGYGTRHDENVLLAVADGGGSTYRFVPDPAVCQLELAQAVGAQGDVAAEGVELTLRPAPGVEILGLLGAGAARYGADGLVTRLADVAARAKRLVAVELRARIDEGCVGGELLRVELRHRRAGEKVTHEHDGLVTVDVAAGAPLLDPAAVSSVLLLRADAVRAAARAMADRGQFEGAAALLRGLMRDIEAAPGYVSADGSALSEAREQLLDEAMAMERKPDAETLATFKMSTAAKSLSAGGSIASSRSQGATALRFASATAGLFPEAYLVVVEGPGAGTERRLAAQNTIGRTSSADFVIASDKVSRRHADVFALEGEFWIADLGSTNVTRVNDRALGTKPHRLKPDDRIQIGSALLRYRELPRT